MEMVIDYTNNRSAVLQDADKYVEIRKAMSIIDCSINRIQYPGEFRSCINKTAFFSNNPVPWIFCLDLFYHHIFTKDINICNKVKLPFIADFNISLKIFQCNLSRISTGSNSCL